MKLIILLFLVTTVSNGHDTNRLLRRVARDADPDRDEIDEMLEDDFDVEEVVSYQGVPRDIPPKVPMNFHKTPMEAQIRREDHALDRRLKIDEFRRQQPDAPEPADDEDLDDFHVDIDVNDTPDEEEVKNDAKNQKSVKLGVLKQRQKVFEEIRALGADLEKLLQDNSGKTQLVVEVVAGKKTKLALEKNGQVVEIIEDDVVDDDEVTGEEDDVDIAASVQTVYDDDKNDEDDDDDIESEDIVFHKQHTRTKRFIIKNAKRLWERALVPYEIIEHYDAEDKNEIEAAMARYERFTCVRFVPWSVNTRQKYDLSHDGRLLFMEAKGCWSHLGNIGKEQAISCCEKGICVRELGHALGLMYEQQNPKRLGFSRINYRNILDNAAKWYYRSDPEDYFLFGYDLSSPMLFKKWEFSKNQRETQSMLFRELYFQESFFYMFHEIVATYNCRRLYCRHFKIECINDGYLSVVNGKCMCMCPEGLDPASGCSSVLQIVPQTMHWPDGQYALFAAKDGCPDGFQYGTVSHWFPSTWKRWKHPNVHMKATFSKEGSTYGFCVRSDDGTHQDTGKTWPQGNYCILRKGGKCPEDFESGSLQFYGDLPDDGQFTSGATPDGEFEQNPRFQFCCKNSGYLEDEMALPNTKPFILLFYRNQYKTCQRVQGMYGTKEEFHVKTLPNRKHVHTFRGAHPQARQWYKSIVYIPICYYRPYNSDCGGILKLTKEEPLMTMSSPNFPGKYYNDLHCYWLIKSPPNTTIVLNFDNFQLEEVDGRCRDSLEISHVRIGQPGAVYCGDGFERSIHSVSNVIKLTLRTDTEVQQRGFSALLKAIFPSEMCYNVYDHGRTYRGKMNFTRNMEPCLPWTEVTKCKHHTFKTKDVFSGLDSNYCRNPGNGFSPWCYVSKIDCVRDYCDVCLTERLFDKVDNCEELKQIGFCTNGQNVLSKCAYTCAQYLPPMDKPIVYSEVKCARPDDLKDVRVVSSGQKLTYSVGQVIKLACVDSYKTTLAWCLTDGQWSVGTYVCGACAVGWSFYAGNCYRYFNMRHHHGEAKRTCRSYGGTLAITRTVRQEAFVLSLREEGKTIWLAATDVQHEGYWVWPGHRKLTYSNWKKGQPNNLGNEDCAIITPEGKWNDVRCFWYEKHRFVCQTRIGDSKECVDRRPTCQDVLQARPTFCFDFQNFARHECQFTCGLCDTESDHNCPLPRPTVNTTFVEKLMKGEGVTRGDTFTHSCIDGYQRVGGDPVRACLFCGVFTGSPLVCMDMDDTTGPNSNVELLVRQHVGRQYHYYTGDTGEMRIQRNGQVTHWEFVTSAGGTLAFQVWRPVEDLGENHYELVGESIFKDIPDGLELRSKALPPNERIKVKNGDLVGVYYDHNRAHLTYDECSDTSVHVYTIDHFKKQIYKLEDIAKFSEDIGCAIFSMRAIIAPNSES